jgi:hypothetical protein
MKHFTLNLYINETSYEQGSIITTICFFLCIFFYFPLLIWFDQWQDKWILIATAINYLRVAMFRSFEEINGCNLYSVCLKAVEQKNVSLNDIPLMCYILRQQTLCSPLREGLCHKTSHEDEQVIFQCGMWHFHHFRNTGTVFG